MGFWGIVSGVCLRVGVGGVRRSREGFCVLLRILFFGLWRVVNDVYFVFWEDFFDWCGFDGYRGDFWGVVVVV